MHAAALHQALIRTYLPVRGKERTPQGYFVYSDKTVSTYYADLGFATNPEVNLDQEVSLEGLSKIDADFIFLGEAPLA
ncbi:hypothetical protein M3650_03455 [Paenibacillus sp. MER TA 81-3]|uniref:hypothetical protein n=1 Tax=Paenibacillus sp. MER TA 81-3 TaxID=2939573 RepID=UPI00203A896C|nr:hypothetical protein [Paenibacillus sp. MER TA 81-3]MCM3337719.1 hypothetical protein [Paenibacillus sp. MER TA 81-3]